MTAVLRAFSIKKRRLHDAVFMIKSGIRERLLLQPFLFLAECALK